MSIAGFPTSSDIYLEADGVRLAVVQSYAEGRPMPGAPSEKTRGLYYRTVL